MSSRSLKRLSIAFLAACALTIAGCGEADVEVKETVSTPASTSTEDGGVEKEGCCGGCCDADKTTLVTSAAKEKECCGKCEKDSAQSESQLVATKTAACEYCKTDQNGKACAECKKQATETVATTTEK